MFHDLARTHRVIQNKETSIAQNLMLPWQQTAYHVKIYDGPAENALCAQIKVLICSPICKRKPNEKGAKQIHKKCRAEKT